MAGEGKIKIKVEHFPTKELYVELKETDKVQDLIDIVQNNWDWGPDFITFDHGNLHMRPDRPLSAYYIEDGSVVTATKRYVPFN